MGPFLRKTAIALLLAAVLHAAAGFLADGTTDEFYLRFTTPRQRAMILGGSRAAQGLHPSVFNDRAVDHAFEGPMYGFAFTIAHSPYGATYREAIAGKLDPGTRNGLFILQVDPWLLSDAGSLSEEPEHERLLGEQITLNARPNYEYLLRYFDRGWGALAYMPMGDPDTSMVLMNDGRLAVHVAMDSATVARRTRNKTRTYRDEYLPGRTVSAPRQHALAATARMLAHHGTVVLVRLPVGRDIMAMEEELDPRFDQRMDSIATASGARYIDLDTMAATFTDGNHLDEPSGLQVTAALRMAIRQIRRQVY